MNRGFKTLGIVFLLVLSVGQRGLLSSEVFAAEDTKTSLTTSDLAKLKGFDLTVPNPFEDAELAYVSFKYVKDEKALYLINDKKVEKVSVFSTENELKNSEIEVLYYAHKTPTRPRAALIRHGQWVSLIDLDKNEYLLQNFGPIDFVSNNALRFFVTDDKGQRYLAFPVEMNDPKTQSPLLRLVLIDLNEKSVSFIPIRSDDPNYLNAVLYSSQEKVLHLAYAYPERVNLTDGKVVGVPIFGQTVLFVDKGQLHSTKLNPKDEDESDFENLTGFERIKKTVQSKYYVHFTGAGANPTNTNARLEEHLEYKNLSYEDAEKLLHARGSSTGNLRGTSALGRKKQIDAKAQRKAIEAAQSRIDLANEMEENILQSTKFLKGQSDAVKAFIKFAQNQIGASKFSVIVLGGTTGTGKTSGFTAFMQGLFPNKKEPVWSLKLSENQSEELLATKLGGPSPGYVGYGDLTGLMIWMIENTDGGGILLDEIEKAPVEVLNVLLAFLDKGEVTLNSKHVEKLIERYQDKPMSQWPQILREKNNDGQNIDVEINLKLTPKHVVALATNAGEEIFNGSGTSSVQGRRLKSVQEIKAANARFTGEMIKSELQARGYPDALLNRVVAYIPYKVLLPEDHNLVVDDRIEMVRNRFNRDYLIDFSFEQPALEFIKSDSYDPLNGARHIHNQIETWVEQNLNQLIVKYKAVKPGDKVTIRLVPKGEHTPAQLVLVDGDKQFGEPFVIGRPLPARPTELLERARKNLYTGLTKKIVGHTRELKSWSEAIISELAKAVNEPKRQGKPIVRYFDSTPGVGKTETAKATAAVLFDDESGLVRVNMNEITTMDDFYEKFVKPIAAHVRTSPESLVVLLDEFPRAGENSPYKAQIQNMLLSIFDEGVLPAVRDEVRYVNGNPVRSGKPTALPPASLFICTGNLAERALMGSTEFMNNRRLMAEYNYLLKHPERLRTIYEAEFIAALRSRMGEPILFSPLTDEEVEMLRDRFFKEKMSIVNKAGIQTVMDQSLKEFLMEQYVPIKGARWMRDKIEKVIESPVNTIVVGNEAHYTGTTFTFKVNKDTRDIWIHITKNGKLIEEKVLTSYGVIPDSYHPEAVNRAAWKTCVHEAGHAIVERALYGKLSVHEINTFGGGEGGWMAPHLNVADRDMYHTTTQGPYRIAVALAGHNSEVLFLGQSANGASSDFDTTRSIAQTMILDGSTLGIAPFPQIKNPSTGKIEPSEKNKQELEQLQEALMDFGGRLSRKILEMNADVVKDVAQALMNDPNMQMNAEQFEKIVGSKIKTLSKKEIKKLATVDPSTRLVCSQLLVRGDHKLKGGTVSRLWNQFLNFFFPNR